MKVAIIQSNYLPWKGYFDIINSVDLFMFYDDVQYTWRDWRNRNLVKMSQKLKWLTVPVGSRTDRLICEVSIDDSSWQKKHYRLVNDCYAKARYFADFKPFLEEVYLQRTWANLSALNQFLIRKIASEFLGIKTSFADSREYAVTGKGEERLVQLLKKVGATDYLSGPSARSYLREGTMVSNGIRLHWQGYEGYPEYEQFYPPFEHRVTILDLLFHTGPEAPNYIWGWRGK